MKDLREIICGLSNGAIANDLEWRLSHFGYLKPFKISFTA